MDNFDNAEQPSVTKLYKLTSCDTYQFCHIDVKKCVNVTFEHFVECLGRFDYISVFFGRKLGRNALECYNFCVFNLSFSLDPTIKLEELQNSFPELPSWIAQQYLTQFEQQVFSIFQNSYKNFTILQRKLTFFAKNYHFSLY